jgi:CRP-like cAMP-binding protein
MGSSKIKVQDFLIRLPLFNAMTPAELDRVAIGTTEMRIPRGEIVFRKGDPCVGFHTVVYGQIKLAFTSPHGGEKVVEIIGPGHSFGEALMFMEKPYIVSAQALADTLLLHVSKAVVFDELQHDPEFSRKMLAGLSRRLHGLMGDVEAISLRSGTQRLVGYLLKGELHDEETQVTLPASKTVVASRLNLTPEHFSRILHDLCENQLISVSGRQITILDMEKLRHYEG